MGRDRMRISLSRCDDITIKKITVEVVSQGHLGRTPSHKTYTCQNVTTTNTKTSTILTIFVTK